MGKFNAIVLASALVLSSAAGALAGKDDNNGNAYGKGDNGKNNDARGLSISGENGRVDNGWGNGGENLQGNTPNANGEDGRGDNDDDHGAANDNR